jgi:hypothetical protein
MKGWLSFDEAVAYLRTRGLADADALLSSAIEQGSVRAERAAPLQRASLEHLDPAIALYAGIAADDDGPEPVVGVHAGDVRAYALAVKSGKPFRPKPERKVSRLWLKPTEQEAARKAIAECRERSATNAEEWESVDAAVGRHVTRDEFRELRREFGPKVSGPKAR